MSLRGDPESHVPARPLLIKGLEYDYAVVADVSKFDAHEPCVSMTRGARGLSVVSDAAVLSPRASWPEGGEAVGCPY